MPNGHTNREATTTAVGRVLDIATSRPIAGLRVEAWGVDDVCGDVVAVALSDAFGEFQISLGDGFLRELFGEHRPVLFFRIFREERLIADTRDEARWDTKNHSERLRLCVNLAHPVASDRRPAPLVVRGRVTHATDGPLGGFLVRVFDRNLAPQGFFEDQIGEGRTDSLGMYRIELRRGEHAPETKMAVDLVVRGADAMHRAEAFLARAPATATVDLTIGGEVWRGPSEYEGLVKRLAPALAERSGNLAELDDEEVRFVTASVGIDEERVRLLRDVNRLGQETGLSVEVLYGLARVWGPGTRFESLGLHSTASLERAVGEAIDRNLISPRFRAELGAIAARLSNALLSRALVPKEGEDPSPGSILATSLVPEQLGRDFAARVVAHRGAPAEFWTSVTSDPQFAAPGVIDDLRLTLQIAVLTQHHLPLMLQLRELRRTEQVRTLRDLAAFEENDWRRLLERTATNGQIWLPPHILGEKPEDRVSNYLAGIIEPLRAVFPTDDVRRTVARAPEIDAALVRKLLTANPDLDPHRPLPKSVSWEGISEAERDRALGAWRAFAAEVRAFPAWRWRDALANGGVPQNPIREAVARVLERAPDLDLRTTNIDRHLAANPTLLEGVLEIDRDAAVRQLKTVQRVYRVAPRGDHVTALLAAGMRSARSIARTGRNRFVAKYAPILGGEGRALEIYSQSVHYAMTIDAAYASSQADAAIAPYAVEVPNPPPSDPAASPEAVFGPLSTCACEHCQSVYSPSAYCVDLLHQLDPSDWDGPGDKPVDVLFARRPDLPKIPITCENAFTPLPYIDLVNEVLEAYVQSQYGVGAPPPFDTGGVSAEELAAVPQHVNDAAYDVLRGGFYPPTLPFDRPLEVARSYLEQLGAGRYELLETFRRGNTPTEDDLAAEALGISSTEYAIVAGLPLNPPASTPELYGYAPNDATWLGDIEKAPVFLRRTGLRYEDLVELIKTWFVNRHQSDLPQRITLTSPPDCNLAETKITPLPVEALGRAHRFVRLWRKLGWSMADLDRALVAFGATEIDAPLLRKLAWVRQLAADLRLPVVRLLALWSRIDAWGREALYFQLFDNPSIPKAGSNEPEWPPIQLPFGDPDIKDATSLPEITGGSTLGDFLGSVRAALGVSADDLALIVQHAGLSDSAPLDVGNLSALYRRALLARALRLRVRDLLSLLALGAPDPFQSQGAESTRAFVRLVHRIRGSKFSVPVLEYLYRHRIEPGRTSTPTEERVAESVQKIRDEVARVDADAKAAGLGDQAPEGVLRGAVVRAVAHDLGLDDKLALCLLTEVVSGALDAFLAEEDAPAFVAYARLHKASVLIDGFGFSEPDVRYLWSQGHFDISALPTTEVLPPDPTALPRWQTLDDFASLSSALPREARTLVDLLTGNPHELTSEERLVKAMGWDATDVAALVGPLGFAFGESDFGDVGKLLRVAACIAIARRTGVAAAKLLAWTATWPDAEQARETVDALRARQPHHDAWLAVAKRVNDPLRERQRDALAAFLVPRLGLDSPNDLFGRFLIDVEMSACMPTSRIVQAIGSVQLFVQRALLGHDPDIEAKVMAQAIDPESWKWRKNYRVWEANRKVFLYPENWIEPELRIDKSPFFRELETDVLKGEPTDENLERAVRTYLDKLLDVARLDVISMYWENEVDVLHVFARTASPPYHYYYRRLLYRREWTGWERVPLDLPTTLTGAHLVPVVHNRRLYLFWPVFRNASSDSPGSPPATGSESSDQWKISLRWSEYRSGRWSPTRTSTQEITSNIVSTATVFAHGLRAVSLPEGLEIRVFVQGVVKLSAGELYDFPAEWQLDSPPEYSFGSFAVGSFYLDECGGRIVARGGTTPVPITTPSARLVFFMKFAHLSVLGGSTKLSFESSEVRTVLETVHAGFSVAYPHQLEDARLPEAFRKFFYPFFLLDDRRTYFALPSGGEAATRFPFEALGQLDAALALTFAYRSAPLNGPGSEPTQAEGPLVEAKPKFSFGNGPLQVQVSNFERLRFVPFWHPYVCDYVKSVESRGLPGLLTLVNQDLRADGKDQPGSFFVEHYNPTTWVDFTQLPRYEVDFSVDGAYSLYNWELFFHVPFLVACHLSRNQRHEEAQHWFHYVFDPRTDSDESPQKAFWRLRPLRDVGPTLSGHEMMELLSYTGNDAEILARKQEVENQIAQWEAHPFQPHRIARLRLSAYKKAFCRKYLDNLIAWADSLFARHTREAIQEATQLYLLAAGILGPRPERIPAKAMVEPKTFEQMREALDDFSNLVTAENVIFPFASSEPGDGVGELVLEPGETLYFCTPPNDRLLRYWDTVEDRLFKIRHCMDIEGVIRPLALFEPPIDPALLVRAAAAGLDIQSVLADLAAPRPHHRFVHLVQRAVEFCGEVRAFGAVLLAALEKQDGEALASLRASHETTLLQAIREVRQRQIDEAAEQRAALEKTREVTNRRFVFYRDILPKILLEEEYLTKLGEAETEQGSRRADEERASFHTLIPDATISYPPSISTTFGGSHIGSLFRALAGQHAAEAERHSHAASMLSIKAGWARRQEEWNFKRDDEGLQLKQIDQQIIVSQTMEDIARRELENHQLQTDQSIATRDFLRDKFSNADLYGWMISETSALYYQAYKLAFELARRAERAFQFERGVDSSFIQFGYWDSLRKGLLAGEKLALDLRRLETAHMEQNRREYEITRHVSLVLHDPIALISLKETGVCELDLPEELWDADYPGHYFRRIKSVSITIPCVVGPYTSVNCTLTLLGNRIRTSTDLNSAYREQSANDARFLYDFAAVQSIATSQAQNDAGLFELNFRDERYLPFEGAGAISSWRIELPRETNAFDFETISDIVLRISYTAREGGAPLRAAALASRDELLALAPSDPNAPKPPLRRLLSARHEFSDAWQRFLHPQPDAAQTLELPLSLERFPYLLRGREIHVTSVDVYLKPKEGTEPTLPPAGLPLVLETPDGLQSMTLETPPPAAPIPLARASLANLDERPGTWTLRVDAPGPPVLTPATTRDLIFVFTYYATKL